MMSTWRWVDWYLRIWREYDRDDNRTRRNIAISIANIKFACVNLVVIFSILIFKLVKGG